jgi:hypothetical protein
LSITNTNTTAPSEFKQAGARDGRNLFYRQADNLMAVSFSDGSPLPGNPRLLFQARLAPTSFGSPNYDVGRDGRFLDVEPTQASSSTHLHVVVNWAATLKQLVPG